MDIGVRFHGTDHRDVIDHPGQMGQPIGHDGSGAPTGCKEAGGSFEGRSAPDEGELLMVLEQFGWDGFSVQFLKPGLWIKKIHMRRPARHEEKNDPLGLGCEMGSARIGPQQGA